MAEFASMRASVTGSAVPTHGYSYCSSENGESGGNAYTELGDAKTAQKDGNGEDGAGNTVTFGGVKTFAPNSIAGSTTGGSTTGGIGEGIERQLIYFTLTYFP